MRLLTSFRSGLELYLHFFIEKTRRTGKILIMIGLGDKFDKTLKLQYLKWGGHMGCLYYTKAIRLRDRHLHQFLDVSFNCGLDCRTYDYPRKESNYS